MKPEKKRVVLNSLIGAFGFKPGAHSIIGTSEGLNITVGDAPIEKKEIDIQKLRNLALRNELDLASHVDIIKEANRIIISLNNRILFQEGSDQIVPQIHKFLFQIAEILQGGPSLIEFRGYVSHSETILQPDPFMASMSLSAKRALSVYSFFKDRAGILAQRMVAHGFGMNRPAKKRSPTKRDLNRQVEIILDYQSVIPYRLRNPAREDSLLDFKGFFFKIPGDAGAQH